MGSNKYRVRDVTEMSTVPSMDDKSQPMFLSGREGQKMGNIFFQPECSLSIFLHLKKFAA